MATGGHGERGAAPPASGTDASAGAEPAAPPADRPRARSYFAALKAAVGGYRADNAGDLAAALTYFGILAIFPALIALLSILGLVGQGTTKPLVDSITTIVPGSAQKIFTDSIHSLQHNRGGAGIIFFVGILAALWSASGYVSGFIRASKRSTTSRRPGRSGSSRRVG
jgi:membrane protein